MEKANCTKANVKRSDLARLTKAERKIYDSILNHFPVTSHDSAMDAALQGGVNWQFYPS